MYWNNELTLFANMWSTAIGAITGFVRARPGTNSLTIQQRNISSNQSGLILRIFQLMLVIISAINVKTVLKKKLKTKSADSIKTNVFQIRKLPIVLMKITHYQVLT